MRAGTSFLVAAATALAAGELASAAVQHWRSPVQAVAETVIDRSPSSITRFGIETFGTNDKLALVIGILVVTALLAPALGVVARNRPWLGDGAFVAFGVVGVAASAQGASITSGMPSVVAAATGIVVARYLARFARADEAAAARPEATLDGLDRRRFVLGATAFVAAASIAAATGRALQSRFSAAASRAALLLPGARSPLPAAASGASFEIDGLAPLFTPNDIFYRIDTALTVPQLPVEDWTLRVHGMVDSPFEIDFEELAAFGLVEVDITLTCVSNPIGGDLVGNARWLGVPLRTLLDEAGVDPDADQIVGRSSDDYTCGFPLEAAYDRDAIVAVGMNGEPLPLQHGFPARLVTPGLYGYVSATKWLTEIELTRFDRFDQYWVPRGYADRAPIKTMTRIDVPRSGNILDTGDTLIAGVAWAQTRGISRVEIQVDDQPFVDAELAEALNEDTWRQWRFPWTATEGNHRIAVRATDGTGQVQTDTRAEILPDGASGWQSRLVTVRPSP
ncbi:MAG: molybdopterin-dependent oxidoreductase [Acidimicrobiales bacterium]